jgi:holo-[acyl-carrier protein] synthase
MMITGVGTDICKISRIEALLAEHGLRFVERVAAADEDAASTFSASQLARRFALKEAVAKALGTGIGEALGFADIVVSHTSVGALVVSLPQHPHLTVQASVSDDTDYAVAFVVIQNTNIRAY